jgi:hypothetical protein
MGSIFSFWQKTTSLVGTVVVRCLSPLLFSIYTADIKEYLEVVHVSSYADNTTTYM